jgi:hypothetical protein
MEWGLRATGDEDANGRQERERQPDQGGDKEHARASSEPRGRQDKREAVGVFLELDAAVTWAIEPEGDAFVRAELLIEVCNCNRLDRTGRRALAGQLLSDWRQQFASITWGDYFRCTGFEQHAELR